MDIRKLRLKAIMSQEELAKSAHISRISVARYEAGTRIPPLDIAKRIALALNCSLDDLTKEDAQ